MKSHRFIEQKGLSFELSQLQIAGFESERSPNCASWPRQTLTIYYHIYLQQYGKYLKVDLIGYKATN